MRGEKVDEKENSMHRDARPEIRYVNFFLLLEIIRVRQSWRADEYIILRAETNSYISIHNSMVVSVTRHVVLSTKWNCPCVQAALLEYRNISHNNYVNAVLYYFRIKYRVRISKKKNKLPDPHSYLSPWNFRTLVKNYLTNRNSWTYSIVEPIKGKIILWKVREKKMVTFNYSF